MTVEFLLTNRNPNRIRASESVVEQRKLFGPHLAERVAAATGNTTSCHYIAG